MTSLVAGDSYKPFIIQQNVFIILAQISLKPTDNPMQRRSNSPGGGPGIYFVCVLNVYYVSKETSLMVHSHWLFSQIFSQQFRFKNGLCTHRFAILVQTHIWINHNSNRNSWEKIRCEWTIRRKWISNHENIPILKYLTVQFTKWWLKILLSW